MPTYELTPSLMRTSVSYPRDKEAAEKVRGHITAALGGMHPAHDAAQLVAVELVTNAIRHGGGDLVHVWTEPVDDGVIVTVVDVRKKFGPASLDWGLPEVTDDADGLTEVGRGLGIVSALCEGNCGAAVGPTETKVWARIPG